MAGNRKVTVEILGDASDASRAFQEGEGAAGRWSGALIAAGAAAVAGIAIAVQQIGEAIQLDAANDRFAAQLGLNAEEAERLGGVAADLYTNAWGGSIGEVNDAIRSVGRNLVDLDTISDEELGSITARALDLAGTFDHELGEVTNAAGQLMRNELAPNADVALDIIARGFQLGADRSGDFLDTLNEYADPFRSIGLDAAEATGIIASGLEAGAFNADKIGDAINEFGIRAIDGSATTNAAFESLGLNAEATAATIAAGGEGAQATFTDIIQRLQAMGDTTEQEAAGVGLFGSMWEDMGADAILALDPATAALTDFEGTAQSVSDTVNDNLGVTLESFKRRALFSITQFVEERVLPALEDFAAWFNEHWPRMQAVAVEAWERIQAAGTVAIEWIRTNAVPVLRSIVEWVRDHWPEIRASAEAVFAAVTTAVRTAIDFLQAEVIPRVQAFVADVGAKIAELRAWWDEHWTAIREAVGHVLVAIEAVISAYVAVIQELWARFGENILTQVRNVWEFIREFISNVILAVKGVIETVMHLINGDWGAAWESFKQIPQAIWQQILNITDLALSTLTNLLDVAWAALKELASAAFGALRGIISEKWDEVLIFVLTWPAMLAEALAPLAGKLAEAARGAMVAFLTTAADWVREDVVPWFGRLPGRIVEAIGDLGRLLYEVGRDVIRGFIDGLTSMFGAVRDTLGGLTGSLTSWKGPPAVDRRILRESGRMVIGGFNDGLLDQIPETRGILSGLTADLPAIAGVGLAVQPPLAVGTSVTTASPATRETHLHFHGPVFTDSGQVTRMVEEGIRRSEALAGVG